MAALLMFETAVSQITSLHTGHSPVVGPSELALKAGAVSLQGLSFPSCHSRSHVGSTSDVRFSLSTATHAPPGLHRRYSALREESAKVRGGGMCVWVSLGNLGSVWPYVWLQLHRRLACGTKPCPAFFPVSDSCRLGVGALVSCNSCDPPPPLASASLWARGRGGRQPVVPEAPLQHVCMCLGVHHSFLVAREGGFRGKMELTSFLEQKHGL